MGRVRRFARILLNAATVLSLVLCVATAVVWVRSYYVCDAIAWTHGGLRLEVPPGEALPMVRRTTLTHWFVFASRGRFAVGRIRQESRATINTEMGVRHRAFPPPRSDLIEPNGAASFNVHRIGFQLLRSTRRDASGWDAEWAGMAPAWFLLALFGLSAWRLWTASARRRRADSAAAAARRCTVCGYDLRATSDRCPECGAIPTTTTTPAAQQPGTQQPGTAAPR
jgi:hypothetical protein